MTQVIEVLQNFLIDKHELTNIMDSIDLTMAKAFKLCTATCFSSITVDSCKQIEIDSIVDYLHDELNTGHWSQVPVTIRYAFTAATYIKCLLYLKRTNNYDLTNLQKALQIVDLGVLLGAPLIKNPELLTNCARYLNEQIRVDLPSIIVTNKRKSRCEFVEEFNRINGIEIETESCPSLETFSKLYFNRQPVKLKDCMSHWPAMNKWLDVNYLIRMVGNRTIPIEIGSHYVDDDWHQKLMLFSDFIKEYFLESSDNIGYLAQHNLFDQIPELKNDIYVPDYCCLTTHNDDASDPDINAWLGPEGTVSPLHQDPKNNFLTQVFGTKQIILISPDDTRFLYTFDDKLLANTSRVDPINPDLLKYPDFIKAKVFKCLLEPGEMLYIPVKWWHHVTALDKSFSVSFWWD